jgi:uncharacterized protein YutE (UPF0331/DUF86 family)
MKNGIILRKLADMDDTLRHLREYVPGSFDAFAKDWGCQKIVERSLQILIEAMIDIGERLIAVSGSQPCDTAAAVMTRIGELDVIKDPSRYVPMVRFRNLLVHQYEAIDLAVLYGLVTKRLADVEAFISEIRAYAEAH